MDAAVGVSDGMAGVSEKGVADGISADGVPVSVTMTAGVTGVGVLLGSGAGGMQDVNTMAEQLKSTISIFFMATSCCKMKVRIHIPMLDLCMCDWAVVGGSFPLSHCAMKYFSGFIANAFNFFNSIQGSVLVSLYLNESWRETPSLVRITCSVAT